MVYRWKCWRQNKCIISRASEVTSYLDIITKPLLRGAEVAFNVNIICIEGGDGVSGNTLRILDDGTLTWPPH